MIKSIAEHIIAFVLIVPITVLGLIVIIPIMAIALIVTTVGLIISPYYWIYKGRYEYRSSKEIKTDEDQII